MDDKKVSFELTSSFSCEEEEEYENGSASFETKPTNNELKIRFKLAKSAWREEKEDGSSENRVCKLCNKTFSSGRALGGHMRVHSEVKDDERIKIKDISNPPLMEKSKNSNAICPVCKRKFVSMKSLFGHMRNHPERDWRGIHPPKMRNSSLYSTVSDTISKDVDDQYDSNVVHVSRVPSLSKWPATGKRNRKTYSANNHQEDLKDHISVSSKRLKKISLSLDHGQSSEDPMSEAVFNLLLLSHGGHFDSFLLSKKEEDGLVTETQPINLKTRTGSKESSIDSSQRIKAPIVSFNRRNQESRINFSYDINKKTKRRKKKKSRKIRELRTVQEKEISLDGNEKKEINQQYVCRTCNKAFPSHQALGGHRSSHKKPYSNPQQNEIDEFLTRDDNDDTVKKFSALDPMHNSPSTEAGETITETSREHKKCHCNESNAPANSVTSSNDFKTKDRVSFDFDLNELPTIDDDDLELLSSEQSLGLILTSNASSSVICHGC